MNLRHLEILEAVARAGTFTGAAQKLFLTQSAVSHAVAELERQAGAPLFDRMPRGVRLTPCGTLLLEEARGILAACRELEGRLAGLEEEAPVKLVSSITIASFPLPEILRQDGLEAFYEIENKVGTDLNRTHTVIATGGSMVLYPEAMAHLKKGSTVIWLQTPFSQLENRMPADLYGRGIAVPAGTPLREIYEERCVLYARYADLIVASQDGESDTARLVEDVMRTVGLEA